MLTSNLQLSRCFEIGKIRRHTCKNYNSLNLHAITVLIQRIFRHAGCTIYKTSSKALSRTAGPGGLGGFSPPPPNILKTERLGQLWQTWQSIYVDILLPCHYFQRCFSLNRPVSPPNIKMLRGP